MGPARRPVERRIQKVGRMAKPHGQNALLARPTIHYTIIRLHSHRVSAHCKCLAIAAIRTPPSSIHRDINPGTIDLSGLKPRYTGDLRDINPSTIDLPGAMPRHTGDLRDINPSMTDLPATMTRNAPQVGTVTGANQRKPTSTGLRHNRLPANTAIRTPRAPEPKQATPSCSRPAGSGTRPTPHRSPRSARD